MPWLTYSYAVTVGYMRAAFPSPTRRHAAICTNVAGNDVPQPCGAQLPTHRLSLMLADVLPLRWAWFMDVGAEVCVAPSLVTFVEQPCFILCGALDRGDLRLAAEDHVVYLEFSCDRPAHIGRRSIRKRMVLHAVAGCYFGSPGS